MTSSRAIDRVAAAFDGARPNGDGWKALCPIHGDTDPSIDINQGTKGVVVICRAGCDTSEVLGARGLTYADLFDDAPAGASNGSNGRRFVEAYPYVDEAGELLFEVVRYDPKDFRQRRPDGNGGWIAKTEGVRRVLYRLPDVVDGIAAGVTIWLVEGEKDVHALERAGQVATTAPGGAGKNKWRPEFTEQLRGARVVIVADDDKPGRDHAAGVAGRLTGVVESIDVRLPAQGHKDIAEHLGAGRSLDELQPFVDKPEADEALSTGIVPIDWATFWAHEGPEEEWLVEPLIPLGRQVALFATAKAGKSLLTLEVAAAIATGRAVLDSPARPPADVVYIDQEMTDADLRERLIDLGYGPDIDLTHLHYFQLQSLPALDGDLGGLILEDIARTRNAVLVVIDTMARVVAGDENDSDTYRHFYRATGGRLKALGVALLRLDHAGKHFEKGQRGSSAKADDVDVVFQLSADLATIKLKRTHSRVPWVPLEVTMTREVEPLLRHVLTPSLFPSGTNDCAALLDRLDVPLDATVKTARAELTKAGQGKRTTIVTAALKYRREKRETTRETPTYPQPGNNRETSGDF